MDHFDVDFSYDGCEHDAATGPRNELFAGDQIDVGRVKAVEKIARSRGVKTGVIFNSVYTDKNASVEENDRINCQRYLDYYTSYRSDGSFPERSIIQCWWDYPSVMGPEIKENTFFNTVYKIFRESEMFSNIAP